MFQLHWNLTIRLFSIITRHSLWGREVLPLSWGAVGVFYSPKPTGQNWPCVTSFLCWGIGEYIFGSKKKKMAYLIILCPVSMDSFCCACIFEPYLSFYFSISLWCTLEFIWDFIQIFALVYMSDICKNLKYLFFLWRMAIKTNLTWPLFFCW